MGRESKWIIEEKPMRKQLLRRPVHTQVRIMAGAFAGVVVSLFTGYYFITLVLLIGLVLYAVKQLAAVPVAKKG